MPKNRCVNKAAKIVLIVLFALCFLPMPYAYYEVVRVVSMAGFVYLAYESHKNESSWVWIYGVSALLINPFYRFYITKNIWLVIDAVWIMLLLISFKQRKTAINKVYFGCVNVV